MNRRGRQRLVLTGVVAVALVGVGGGVSIASADRSAPASRAGDASHEGPDGAETDPEFTGSLPAPAETEQSDRDEAASLQALATTSQSQAEATALAAVPGTVAGSELETDEGFVVYQVSVTQADGTVIEVTVDAGNGTVLTQSRDDDPDATEN
jgi:hypothetical protein